MVRLFNKLQDAPYNLKNESIERIKGLKELSKNKAECKDE